MSFLGCLQQCSVLFIKTTYSREPWHCGVQREERIVHTFASFRNWLNQNNAPCLISLFNVKYGLQHKLNYNSMPSAFSLAKKLNLLLWHRNCGSADLHLEMRWGQPSKPWDNGERSQKNCFSALWASFWSENMAGAAPRAPSLDPPLSSHDSHVLSIQFGDNHVVWSEANYYCSWHLAKKLMFNCIIQPVNSWIKSTCKITFIGLAAQ